MDRLAEANRKQAKPYKNSNHKDRYPDAGLLYLMMKHKTANLSDRQPVFSLQSDKLVLKDGRVAVGFHLSGAPLESWTPGHYQQASALLSQQIRQLPVGSVVQKIDIFFDQAYRPKEKASGYYDQKLQAHFLDRLALRQESYLFLSFPPSKKDPFSRTVLQRPNPITSAFAYGKALLKNPFADVESLLSEVEALATEFAEGLYALPGVRLTRLKEEGLNNLLLRYLNLDFASSSEQKASSLNRPMYNGASCLAVGEKKVNVVTMIEEGSEVLVSIKDEKGVSSPYVYPLSFHLQFPHILTQCILVEDTESGLKALDFDRKLNGSLEWLTTQDHQIKAEELNAFTAYVRSAHAHLVSLHQSVIVFDSDEAQRKAHLERVVSAMRQLYGAEALVESYDTANMFFASLPGNGFQHYRWLTTSDEIAACYLQLMGNVTSDQTGDYLCDRHRNLLQVNLFNTEQSNQNCVVIGPSGSGKSYTMGHLIAQRFERGARQIIIDKGGTYRNVVYALNGQEFDQTYFEYSPEKPLSFNPFLLDKDESGQYRPTSEKTNFLIALLSILWKGGAEPPVDRPGQGTELTAAERAIFQMLLPRYYAHIAEDNKNQAPGMHSFYEFLLAYHQQHQHDEEYLREVRYFDMEQFFIVLRPFVKGAYRDLLNARQEIDISEHILVCFDLDKVNSDPTLYPLITLLITELALDQIRKYPDQIKYLYLDEAWAMLSGKLKSFIEDLFRTIRKNNGSVNIITQGLSEIKNASIGEAVLVNADTKIILKHQDQRLIEELSTYLGFTGHEQDLVKSIRVEKGFRELFIKQGEAARVYVLETSPQLDAILSSKPAERNYLRKLIDRYHGNLSYAINQFIEDKYLSTDS